MVHLINNILFKLYLKWSYTILIIKKILAKKILLIQMLHDHFTTILKKN